MFFASYESASSESDRSLDLCADFIHDDETSTLGESSLDLNGSKRDVFVAAAKELHGDAMTEARESRKDKTDTSWSTDAEWAASVKSVEKTTWGPLYGEISKDRKKKGDDLHERMAQYTETLGPDTEGLGPGIEMRAIEDHYQEKFMKKMNELIDTFDSAEKSSELGLTLLKRYTGRVTALRQKLSMEKARRLIDANLEYKHDAWTVFINACQNVNRSEGRIVIAIQGYEEVQESPGDMVAQKDSQNYMVSYRNCVKGLARTCDKVRIRALEAQFGNEKLWHTHREVLAHKVTEMHHKLKEATVNMEPGSLDKLEEALKPYVTIGGDKINDVLRFTVKINADACHDRCIVPIIEKVQAEVAKISTSTCINSKWFFNQNAAENPYCGVNTIWAPPKEEKEVGGCMDCGWLRHTGTGDIEIPVQWELQFNTLEVLTDFKSKVHKTYKVGRDLTAAPDDRRAAYTQMEGCSLEFKSFGVFDDKHDEVPREKFWSLVDAELNGAEFTKERETKAITEVADTNGWIVVGLNGPRDGYPKDLDTEPHARFHYNWNGDLGKSALAGYHATDAANAAAAREQEALDDLMEQED